MKNPIEELDNFKNGFRGYFLIVIPIDSIEKNCCHPHNRNRNSSTNRRCKWSLTVEVCCFQLESLVSLPTCVHHLSFP